MADEGQQQPTPPTHSHGTRNALRASKGAKSLEEEHRDAEKARIKSIACRRADRRARGILATKRAQSAAEPAAAAAATLALDLLLHHLLFFFSPDYPCSWPWAWTLAIGRR